MLTRRAIILPVPVGLVVHRAADGIDAIDEYCRRLESALREAGGDVRYVANGWPSTEHAIDPPAWILLQYNPFAWGRWGFAPGLVRDAARLRRTGTPLAIMVHESWVEMADVRTTIMGAWQRLQLRALLHHADLVLTSTEALALELGHGALHVPIATTITPGMTTNAAARVELGLGDGLIVTLFGRANPERALDHARAAVVALADARRPARLTVLNLGADAPPLDTSRGIDVITPGRLSEVELSRYLTASDLVLLPFHDGVSTRRTTLMAALAHGRPVLGLRGRNSDSVLLEHPGALLLTAPGDPSVYADAAVALVADATALRALGEAGRRLYAERFDWPVIARTIAAALIRLDRGAAPPD